MNNKKSYTSIRVLKTLSYLLNKEMSIAEILDYFKTDPNSPCTAEAILKYINTLKAFGINIERYKNKYIIKNFPPYIELNEQEIKGYKLIEQCSLPEKSIGPELQKFKDSLYKKLSNKTVTTLNKITSIKQFNSFYEQHKSSIENIEKLITDKVISKIELVNGKIYNAKPIEIIYKNTKIIIKIFCPVQGKMYDIDISRIKNITPLYVSKNKIFLRNSIMFLLKGRLAKAYTLKEGEYINKYYINGNISVISTLESENTLLKRVMRYTNLCEIISPADTRAKMKELIKKTFSNYLDNNS